MYLNALGILIDEKLKNGIAESIDGSIEFAEGVLRALEMLEEAKYDAVLLDSDTMEKSQLIESIEMISTAQRKIIIMILGERSNLDLVAGSIKAGAYDYILKPVEILKVSRLLEKAVRDHKLKAEKVDKNKDTGDKLIGQTKEIVEVYKMVGKMAASRVPVLVTGEKGTGKKSVAISIHQFSDFSDKPFVSINCTAFQDEFLERKIFGYEKGAFPGAAFDQMGELEKANGGTLYLGNIESLSIDMQSKILGVLQEGEFFRIGGTQLLKTDLRIITASSENIEELIVNGKFIEELYHKLKVLEIDIPPLRDRKDDIPFIIDHYIMDCNEEFGKNVKGVSKPAIKKIMRYDWPGNVSELKNAVRSAVALCRGNSILVEDLPANVIGAKISKRRGDIQDWILADWIEGEVSVLKGNSQKDYYGNVISRVEKELIRQVLEMTSGKKVETAEILGITRNTLRTKMNNYGLE
ncbi:two component, sigma54 specific, transcriptional regulator, Fis family [Ilyobacter polytropus DSM 2926]|uniref:DNA-binding transcriptional regulator NtrC n=1 Tax=Ilyobacter polytropus (strain ATCC 51220 / DSM 2926 / LMG 16218 / CuHBu1) TaxID=572544 RepID=E3H9D8_ILYPC|nr:sigma-54 dependent transcriptional regulator [Ilyobacter polytropus]ADO83047.1 two component, sigma54 specific, transcriptional regulator, Fis family [Ilyobacter polytropus DSM 2926]